MSLRIVAGEIYGYELRYAHGAYVMSDERTVDVLPSTLVRLIADDGSEGWGEACPLGARYLPSFVGGVREALAELLPALVDADPRNLGAIRARMDAMLRGQPAAKSAIDVACWDLLGKGAGLPVATLLGGVRARDFPLYVAIPLDTPEAMAEHATSQLAGGIHRLQLKLGGDPREDVMRTRAVLEATDNESLVIADANGAWRRVDAVAAARLLDGCDRLLLEQPCETVEACLAVRRHTSLPMVLDEPIVDLSALVNAAHAGAMEAINIKLGRVGGLTPARIMRDAAAGLGLRMTIEDTWGGDVTTAAVSHLAASTEPDAILTVSFMNDWNLDHVCGYAPRSANGRGAAPDSPGLGVTVDRGELGAPLAQA